VPAAIFYVAPYGDDGNHQAGGLIAPIMIGTGLKIKCLEALAMGRPVEASSNAAAGLEAADGCGMAIANTPTEAADALEMMLNGFSSWQAFSCAASSFARQ
jgi:polysaccharide biosynthesis protein PslH